MGRGHYRGQLEARLSGGGVCSSREVPKGTDVMGLDNSRETGSRGGAHDLLPVTGLLAFTLTQWPKGQDYATAVAAAWPGAHTRLSLCLHPGHVCPLPGPGLICEGGITECPHLWEKALCAPGSTPGQSPTVASHTQGPLGSGLVPILVLSPTPPDGPTSQTPPPMRSSPCTAAAHWPTLVPSPW